MKKQGWLFILFVFFITIVSCADKKHPAENIISIDVSKNYPEKIITLEDIADVEYVQLEVHDDYLFKAFPQYVSSSTIMINDYTTHDFLFFTRDGKPKSKFNHYGGGSGEYSFVYSVVYNEKEDKVFVMSNNKILVYSSDGSFNYSITLPEDVFIRTMVDYDEESLLIYNDSKAYGNNFVRISKKDASVIEEVNITGHKDISLYARVGSGEEVFVIVPTTYPVLRYKDGFLLTDYSKDTVFFYNRNDEMTPVLVRTPPIFEMEPYVFINSFVEAGDYLFLRCCTVKAENNSIPTTFLMINKNDHSVYRQKILLKDYNGKDVSLCPFNISNTTNPEVGFMQLNLSELREAYDENKLSGRLKDIVEASDDDSNDVYMILKFKQ